MSSVFLPVVAGHAEGADAPSPVTPKNVPHRGGAENPSASALRSQFGASVHRVDVVWGETTVVIERSQVSEIVRWLHSDLSQLYLPPTLIDELSEPFGNSVNQTRSGL